MRLHVAVALLASSGLMLEVLLTRIFSATIWYHFAFLAISVALLGWGLAGFLVFLLARRRELTLEGAGGFALLYALSIPAAVSAIVRLPFYAAPLLAYFAVSIAPFLLAGMALSVVFALRKRDAGRLYFADLGGAALGALAIAGLLSWIGAERAIVATSLAPAIAAAVLARTWIVPAATVVVALLGVAALGSGPLLFGIREAPQKGLYRHLSAAPGARIALTGWNAYSRIDAVVGLPDAQHAGRLYIDSDAWTNVPAWDGRPATLATVPGWYRALPFAVGPPSPHALVIGAGGGSDVLVSLAAGARKVTAVEMNPLVLEFARAFGARSGHL
jgi:hypothetical protein